MKEPVQRAFSFLHIQKSGLGFARDVEAEFGVAFFVAAYSALRNVPVSPALLILGDLSVQGNIKPARSLAAPLQVAKKKRREARSSRVETSGTSSTSAPTSWIMSSRFSSATRRPPR
ncbi:hypothetical protein [Archangium primigenium]|uniref:hypothetical protein n=1 Tax=[Archangium] primigenium TaxID=2792470 RepID=UPI00195CB418|nr:hypothetical protein [Archangium primigenium]